MEKNTYAYNSAALSDYPLQDDDQIRLLHPNWFRCFTKIINRLMNEALQGKEMHPQIVIPMTNFVWITIPLLLKALAFDGRTQLVVQDNRHSNAVKVGGWETHIKSYTIFYFSFADGEVVASKST